MGQNRGMCGAILTPNELVLPLWFLTSVPILVKIVQEMRNDIAMGQIINDACTYYTRRSATAEIALIAFTNRYQ